LLVLDETPHGSTPGGRSFAARPPDNFEGTLFFVAHPSLTSTFAMSDFCDGEVSHKRLATLPSARRPDPLFDGLAMGRGTFPSRALATSTPGSGPDTPPVDGLLFLAARGFAFYEAVFLCRTANRFFPPSWCWRWSAPLPPLAGFFFLVGKPFFLFFFFSFRCATPGPRPFG